MKPLNFVSQVNGLAVSMPGDAATQPGCGKVMCEVLPEVPCPSQPEWGVEPTEFGFIAGTDGNDTGLFVAGGFGTPTTDMPPGNSVWTIYNDGAGIRATLTRNPHLLAANGATITITTNGETPAVINAVVSGGGITGTANPGWQFVVGKKYCVSITLQSE